MNFGALMPFPPVRIPSESNPLLCIQNQFSHNTSTDNAFYLHVVAYYCMNEFVAIRKTFLSFCKTLGSWCTKQMKRSDHCEQSCVKALTSKNSSTWENAVSQMLYGSWILRVMDSWHRVVKCDVRHKKTNMWNYGMWWDMSSLLQFVAEIWALPIQSVQSVSIQNLLILLWDLTEGPKAKLEGFVWIWLDLKVPIS